MATDRSAEGSSEADARAACEAVFADVGDGCGCVELWEYLSTRRREASEAP